MVEVFPDTSGTTILEVVFDFKAATKVLSRSVGPHEMILVFKHLEDVTASTQALRTCPIRNGSLRILRTTAVRSSPAPVFTSNHEPELVD